jgi:hypothetical protein
VTDRFDSFVIFGAMRTGSNFLESSLNSVPGVACHGEAFNAWFIGAENRTELLGFDLKRREADPLGFLETLRSQPGLNGFRYFHDHDARIVEAVMDDPRCAKIVLARNPVDSFISRRMAYATDQWKLSHARDRNDMTVSFAAANFERFLSENQAFYLRVLHALQTRGQTAFFLAYEDLGDTDVLNGLLSFLGVPGRLAAASSDLVRQNPKEIAAMITNLPLMHATLERLDLFNLSRIPNFEPRRGPAVPGYVAARGAALLYMPVRCGPEAAVRSWLAGLGSAPSRGIDEAFNRNSLRIWLQDNPGHRKFTVLSHPALRAFRAYADHFSTTGYAATRAAIRDALAMDVSPATGDADAVRKGFTEFLGFVRMNLDGQTSLRPDPIWASQTAILEGFAQLCVPDILLREDELAAGLADLAGRSGGAPPDLQGDTAAKRLAAIWDADLEKAVHAAYRRDYLNFGFGPYAA